MTRDDPQRQLKYNGQTLACQVQPGKTPGVMFLGGAAGSALSMHAYARFGWMGVVIAGSALIAIAAALQLRHRFTRR